VSVVDLDEKAVRRLKAAGKSGVRVSEVRPGSPGEKANIGIDDIVIKVNGVPVATPREMQNAILGLPIGQAVDVVVMRGDQLFLTKLVAEEQHDLPGTDPKTGRVGEPVDFSSLGMNVSGRTPDLAARAGLPQGAAAIAVESVAVDSPAAQAGLSKGQVIVKVDKVVVDSPQAFRSAIERASRERGAVLHVLRPNGNIDFVILKLP
jgi:serine protease Do